MLYLGARQILHVLQEISVVLQMLKGVSPVGQDFTDVLVLFKALLVSIRCSQVLGGVSQVLEGVHRC